MRCFFCMANHAEKVGARFLWPKPQIPCTRITQGMPESLGFQGILRDSVRIMWNQKSSLSTAGRAYNAVL